MHKLLTGLCVALLSIQSVAMDKDHHKSHHHQSNSFVTVEVEGIVLSNFRARASIGQMKNSGAYGDIQSNTNDRLIRASSSVAAVVELHEHINDDGIMRMREVEGGLVLKANQSMIMKPGGYHIMLISLHKPLKDGDLMDLLLQFESGKLIELSIPVVSIKKLHH
jgi:copper(I)-binding protein